MKKLEIKFPYIETRKYNNLSEDLQIYRYFSFCKLEKLLKNKEIWFANADKFPDKNERTIPESFYNESKNIGYINKKQYDFKRNIIKAYVSCWTKSKDNYAFWKIYTPNNDGCMIATTLKKVCSFLDVNNFITYDVIYTEGSKKDSNRVLPVVFLPVETTPSTIYNMEQFKIAPYKFEEEVRFVFYSEEDDIGKGIPIDINELIDSVTISPFANERTANAIQELLSKYIPNIEIKQSSINEKVGK